MLVKSRVVVDPAYGSSNSWLNLHVLVQRAQDPSNFPD